MLKKIQSEIKKLKNPVKAKILQGFFKTGKGQYGEGDVFLGITVPKQRLVAKKYSGDITLADLDKLIKSPVHEQRLIALLILVDKFRRSNEKLQKKIYNFYLAHTKYINNWDLVDLSADKIVGAYLEDRDRSVLLKLARSKSLWERRIAILSTFHYIKRGQAKWTLKLATMLLKDEHDLIHKATGWMLREVGKRCGQKVLTDFLNKHYKQRPRTMLRYAIERLPINLKKRFLAK